MRIHNKETNSSASPSASSDFVTANDYSWLIKAMDQLSVARQVRGLWDGERGAAPSHRLLACCALLCLYCTVVQSSLRCA